MARACVRDAYVVCPQSARVGVLSSPRYVSFAESVGSAKHAVGDIAGAMSRVLGLPSASAQPCHGCMCPQLQSLQSPGAVGVLVIDGNIDKLGEALQAIGASGVVLNEAAHQADTQAEFMSLVHTGSASQEMASYTDLASRVLEGRITAVSLGSDYSALGEIPASADNVFINFNAATDSFESSPDESLLSVSMSKLLGESFRLSRLGVEIENGRFVLSSDPKISVSTHLSAVRQLIGELLMTSLVLTGSPYGSSNSLASYHMVVHGLARVEQAFGVSSAEATLARSATAMLLKDLASRISTTFGGHALFYVTVADLAALAPGHVLHRRGSGESLGDAQPTGTVDDCCYADNADYQNVQTWPAVFHICMWMTVALVLALAAVVYSLAGMDMGADSVLVRTASRPKTE
jgi:hypothetical protein